MDKKDLVPIKSLFCSECIHFRVCFLHRKYLQAVEEIKNNPTITKSIAEIINKLANYCMVYKKGNPYA